MQFWEGPDSFTFSAGFCVYYHFIDRFQQFSMLYVGLVLGGQPGPANIHPVLGKNIY